MTECRVCLIEHDDEIHAATLSVHQWLRQRLRRVLEPAPPSRQRKDVLPGLPGITTLSLSSAEQRTRASRLGGLGQRRRAR